jgi:predicted phosphodiesterase
MRIAICSDIHGNRHAFEAVVAAAESDGADELWCLGDLVGYGAEPDACVQLAERHCAICLAGNHDLAVVDVLSLEEFSRGAALAAQWTRDVIAPETRDFLLSLKPGGGGEGFGLFHVALSFHRAVGEPATGTTRREGQEVDLTGGEWLINPGSTGQPRDGDPRAAWLLLDTEAMTATWRRAEYDIAGAQAAIRAANLPDSLAERLQYGQ